MQPTFQYHPDEFPTLQVSIGNGNVQHGQNTPTRGANFTATPTTGQKVTTKPNSQQKLHKEYKRKSVIQTLCL